MCLEMKGEISVTTSPIMILVILPFFSIFRLGDGHSGSDSKHSDTMSDQGNIPYDVLLQDLTQAKRQLLELHNLVRQYTVLN